MAVKKTYKKSERIEKDNRGGYRPGAGRRKGSKNAKTIERELIRSELRRALPMGLDGKVRSPSEAVMNSDIAAEFKSRVALNSHNLLNAQMSVALGCQQLFKVVNSLDDKNKPCRRHVLVTDPIEVRDFLDDPEQFDGEGYYYMTTQKPDNAAINSLLDRMMGKAASEGSGDGDGGGGEEGIKIIVTNFNTPKKKEKEDLPPVYREVEEDKTTKDGD